MPSSSRAKSCFACIMRARSMRFLLLPAAAPACPGRGGGGTGRGINTSASPTNPAVTGPASCAGNSSRREYLSGSSAWISNSIGTRFSPRTWRVRPVAMNVLTPAIFASPPSAARAAAMHAVGRARLRKPGHLMRAETNQDSCDGGENWDESAHRRWLLRWTGYLDPGNAKTVVDGRSTDVLRTCYGRSTVGGSDVRRKRPPERSSGGLSRS